MGEVIGQILPTAVAVALSPVPIIAVILMLFTPRARSNSIAFVVGWILGLVVVGAIVLALANAGDLTGSDGEESSSAGVIKLAVGLGLLVLAWRNWSRRPRGDEDPEMPGWMATIDNFNVFKSLGLAAFLSGINPKNLLLTIAGATRIAATTLSTSEQIVVLAVFILIASTTVAIPVIVYLIAGDRADAKLTEMKDWLIAHNNIVMAVLLFIIGIKLVGDGISVLSS